MYFASGCRALIMAQGRQWRNLEEAIELHMGWGRFIRVVTEAEAAAGPEAPDTKAELLLALFNHPPVCTNTPP